MVAIILVALALFASSCASMLSVGHENAVCEATEGSGVCAPVESVYALAKEGKLPQEAQKPEEPECEEEEEDCVVLTEKERKPAVEVKKIEVSKSALKPLKVPVRKEEKVQRVWIYPYVDQSGNFIEGHFIYVVVEEGKWLDHKGREVD